MTCALLVCAFAYGLPAERADRGDPNEKIVGVRCRFDNRRRRGGVGRAMRQLRDDPVTIPQVRVALELSGEPRGGLLEGQPFEDRIAVVENHHGRDTRHAVDNDRVLAPR